MKITKLAVFLLTGFLIIGSYYSASAGTIMQKYPDGIAILYLYSWQAGDYRAMYEFLSNRSKQHISLSEFTGEYRDFARQYIIERYSILQTINSGQTAVVYYELTLTGINRPSKSQKGKFNLAYANERWYIEY